MLGERLHAKGQDGARRAKKWLEFTTRADARWVNPDEVALPKLTFPWATGNTFSFDRGGILRGGRVNHQEFLAECKLGGGPCVCGNYRTARRRSCVVMRYRPSSPTPHTPK
jgi:hypothetical protein